MQEKNPFESVYVVNKSTKPVTGRWDGVDYVIKANSTVPFQRFMAEHFKKHNEKLVILELDEVSVSEKKGTKQSEVSE